MTKTRLRSDDIRTNRAVSQPTVKSIGIDDQYHLMITDIDWRHCKA